MSVNDLTGTTWYFNSSLTMMSQGIVVYNIDFTSNSTSYAALSTMAAIGITYDRTYAYMMGSWQNQAYRTISITGGTDATNADLIAWIQANATQVVKYVNKVLQGSTTLIDLTADTVTASDMLSGVTAHDASGAVVTGTLADGNSLAYGSSSCLVGTATVGTAYAWTTVSGTVLEIGRGAVDSTVVA